RTDAATQPRMTSAPRIAGGFRTSRRQSRPASPGERAAGTDADTPSIGAVADTVAIDSRIPDLRVEPPVDQVDHEVRHRVHDADHERHAHDRGKVVGDGRLEGVAP